MPNKGNQEDNRYCVYGDAAMPDALWRTTWDANAFASDNGLACRRLFKGHLNLICGYPLSLRVLEFFMPRHLNGFESGFAGFRRIV